MEILLFSFLAVEQQQENIQFPMRTFNVMMGIIFPASIPFPVRCPAMPREMVMVDDGEWLAVNGFYNIDLIT